MINPEVLGIILPDLATASVGNFTTIRSIASMPFAGRYRLIDFAISNMVNAGVSTVVIYPSRDYFSLYDHIGSGRPWDLNRKNDGLLLFPPRSGQKDVTDIQLLYNYVSFLKRRKEKHVLISSGNMVFNASLSKFVDFHEKEDGDFSFLYHKSPVTERKNSPVVFTSDPTTHRINELYTGGKSTQGGQLFSGIALFNREFLINSLEYSVTHNLSDLFHDYLSVNLSSFRAFAYESHGYFGIVNDVGSYFRNNMNVLRQEVRNELFANRNLIYTKVKDSAPTHFGWDAEISGSLISDGCTIHGRVEDSVLSRNVSIGKNSVVKNSIIMQDCTIGDNCVVENAIFDKQVTVGTGKELKGALAYPFMVNKGISI